MIGWLGATVTDFVTKYNIQLILRVAGTHPVKGEKPPTGQYGVNEYMGCQPKVEQCQINHRGTVCRMWLDMCDVPSRPSRREAWFAQLHGVPARYVCGVFMAMQTLRPWILSTAGCNALRRMRSREGVARQPPRVCGLPVRPICSARSCGKLPRMPTWQACTHFGTCAVHVRSL